MANRIKESNITPGAVTSDKIAPGTVSASNISPGSITTTQIATDTIVSSNIAPGTIANDRLANTGITINGTTIALGASGDIVAGTDWQSVVVADGSTGTTASAGEGYFIDTTSAAHTITLPADGSSTIGDTIIIRDYAGTFGTNNVTLTSTAKISGADSDGTLSTNDLVVTLVYVDSTKGWVTIENEAKAVGAIDILMEATGGTLTTSGDYKIHTFTGDGCFTVSCIAPTNPGVVDYLVVAGGGGGGQGSPGAHMAGGGGAGGFRLSNSTCMPAPLTSPLSNPTGITVTATTYPITVGAGGAAAPSDSNAGSNGSNSSFSTITSAGGGNGGAICNPISVGGPGGSGGGGTSGGGGGNGNTPPVSPPQGNNGSTGFPGQNNGGGGGGGAGAASTQGPSPSIGGIGGAGSYVLGTGFAGCNGTPGPVCGAKYFAGGGTGSSDSEVQSGGVGGGGAGSIGNPVSEAGAGGTNTGGGGGGGSGNGPGVGLAGAGGKGIVIIRYKFQN